MDDAALLGEFIRTQSETAFRTLVERHTGMVYRVCRRALGGNPSEAEDATQATFIVLARKAAGISTAVELPAWLHRVALLAARQARRTLARRRERETRAAAEEATMRHAASHPDDAAATARQHLDDAVGSLSAKLRPAIILHYFEGKTVAETAQALGCAEEAAKKRIAHGLERLRLSLARRGVALPATALSSLLEADATKAAPAALSEAAATVAFASLSGGAWATSGPGLLAKGALKTLFWAKVKTVTAVCAVAVLVGGAGVGAAVTLPLVLKPAATTAATNERLSPEDAWVKELLVRAEAGSWEALDLKSGTILGDPGAWRLDLRGEPAAWRIWQTDDRAVSVVRLGAAKWKRGVIVGRVMMLPAEPLPETLAVPAAAAPLSWPVAGDMGDACRALPPSVALVLHWGAKASITSILAVSDHPRGGWYRFAVYFDTAVAPETVCTIRKVAWPADRAAPPLASWADANLTAFKGVTGNDVGVGLMTKGVPALWQGLKCVPLGPDLLPPPGVAGK